MSSGNLENFSPHTLKRIIKEIQDIKKESPEGISVEENEADLTDIQATIEGPAGTPYAGGFFKVKLVLSKNFPAEPPKGYFLTKIFHPNVATNGEICVNTLKKDWKAEYGLKHILLTIKCLLIVPNAESALNEEAGKLLLEQYEEYFSRAKLYTEIHAKPPRALKESCSEAHSDAPVAKKISLDTKLVDKKKKDKKKTLKRL